MEFKTNSVYSFETHSPAILGNNFDRVTILSQMDYSTTIALGYDVAANHHAIYPTLPSGTPKDYRAYTYLRILTASGSHTFIAIPWIKMDTVKIIEQTSVVVTIQNVDAVRIEELRDLLNYNNFKDFTIKQI